MYIVNWKNLYGYSLLLSCYIDIPVVGCIDTLIETTKSLQFESYHFFRLN